MAKLWEDSVVTAIRDEKWLHALRHGAPMRGYPLPQLKMRGNAESRLGDLIDIVGERFFLFEVKATRQDIKDEWDTENKKDNHLKKAFRVLRKCVVEPTNAVEAERTIELSLRGHFLAYWTEEYVESGGEEITQASLSKMNPPHRAAFDDLAITLDAVVATPYLIGCMTYWEEPTKHPLDCLDPDHAASIIRDTVQSRYSVAFYHPQNGSLMERDHIPLAMLYEGAGRTLDWSSVESGPMPMLMEWGLDLDEMKEYMERLCAPYGASSEELHAVVMSTTGRFFRVFISTAELENMVSPSTPAPSTPRRTRRYERLVQTTHAPAQEQAIEHLRVIEVEKGRGKTNKVRPRQPPR